MKNGAVTSTATFFFRSEPSSRRRPGGAATPPPKPTRAGPETHSVKFSSGWSVSWVRRSV
ncbi:hypothetical protein GGD55_002218 [Rhizobium giardinii]|uniref:Uncharacterized protein n=1 Tax=Rhizobium giardinii TaxID=56731 RepID=A0A7W8UB22_9HYPH|nr:hypothetical protein [Rhizobium giardinii]